MRTKIFKIISIIFIFSCIVFYGYRFVHYYRIYETGDSKDAIKQIKLSKKVIDKFYSTDDMKLIDTDYVIMNNSEENYIKYSGLLWRIVSINDDKEIKIVNDEVLTYLSFNDKYDNSYLNKYLNNKNGSFYSNLEGIETYLTNFESCIDLVTDKNNITCNNKKEYLINTLSITDYANAGGMKSYLNNGYNYWLNNNSNEEYYYVSSDGAVSSTKTTHNYGVRAVLMLSNDIYYSIGDGTKDNPYFVGEVTSNILNQKHLGEYIKFNDNTWQIVLNDEFGTKVVLDGVLDSKRAYGDNSTNYELSSIYNYLNNEYYESIKDKSKIIEGTWFIGNYSVEDNYNYESIYKTNVKAKVGLLNINDFFVGKYKDTFTLTPLNSYSDTIYTINNNLDLYADVITSEHLIRPALYLDSNTLIESGTGLITDPYILR